MTYIIMCKQCTSRPEKAVNSKKFKGIQNTGILYCPHLKVYEKIVRHTWRKKE